MHLTFARWLSAIHKKEVETWSYCFGVIVLLFSLGYALDKAKDFIKQLKSSKSVSLTKGLEARLSIAPINKKEEDVISTHPPKRLDR